MKKFEFKNHGHVIDLDIAGHEFRLTVNAATARKLMRFGEEAQKLANSLPETVQALDEAWDFVADCLDDLLGKGATDRIFEGRAHDLYDIIDVMNYISDEISAEAKRIQSPAIQPVSPKPDFQAALRVLKNPEVMRAIHKATQP